MRIAIIAHDKKKDLMVRFCMSYARILSRHKLFATGTTGKLVQDATGLNIHRYMAGRQGGDQQISARIAYDEIDLLIFFRDTLTAAPYEPSDDMLKVCDTHNIPYATNLVMAEALMYALENGELGKSYIRSE